MIGLTASGYVGLYVNLQLAGSRALTGFHVGERQARSRSNEWELSPAWIGPRCPGAFPLPASITTSLTNLQPNLLLPSIPRSLHCCLPLFHLQPPCSSFISCPSSSVIDMDLSCLADQHRDHTTIEFEMNCYLDCSSQRFVQSLYSSRKSD